MPKQQITIEVDIPDGYEATGEFREPAKGDCWLTLDGNLIQAYEPSTPRGGNRIILRPVWQWPTWLKAGWIAMDISGEWYAYANEPRKSSGGHGWQSGFETTLLQPSCLDFTPPPCTDWTKSLRQNPNIE